MLRWPATSQQPKAVRRGSSPADSGGRPARPRPQWTAHLAAGGSNWARSALLAGCVAAAASPAGAQTPASAPAAARELSVRLQRTPAEVDADVEKGYAHLQAGDIVAARLDYERTLQRDRHNGDALRGLAAIAWRQGRMVDAGRYWQAACEADPNDAEAQAGLLGMAGASAPVAAESRLRILLAARPESAPLNFALGNLHARQARWGEAQVAYFKAVASDGDNPDYLFNLAVALDHLHQPGPAARHYRLALEAAGRRPAAFDHEQAGRRLRDLPP